MPSANSRQLATGVVLLAAAASTAVAAPSARVALDAPSALIRVGGDDTAYAERRDYRYQRRRGPVIDAPFAHVEAGDPVIVDAPGTHVGVHRGHVRVIAPFVDLWIPR